MCFFDQHRFTCGDWKWGHFRQHCAKDYRIGETCGLKLIMQTVPVDSKCKLCDKIDRKKLRRASEVDRVCRWQRKGSKFQASIEKSTQVIEQLDVQIYDLNLERIRRSQQILLPGTDIKAEIGEPQVKNQNASKVAEHRWDQDKKSPGVQNQVKRIQCRLVNKQEISLGLPITFESICNPATVMAVPDTGADENIISLDLAVQLGLELDMHERNEISFGMINQGLVRCSGLAQAMCGFGTTSHLGPSGLSCTFRVSESTISPLIMSYNFLMETQTLSKYRHRLIKIAKSTLSPPCIRAFGQKRQRLLCSLDGQDIEAFPDSGSDVDILSYKYAVQRQFVIEPADARVMFADGSIVEVAGICGGQLTIGSSVDMLTALEKVAAEVNAPEDDGKGFSLPVDDQTIDIDELTNSARLDEWTYRNVIFTRFYVLRDITVEVLLGTASLESLQVYKHHQDQLIATTSETVDIALLSRIVLLGKIEHFLRQSAKKWFRNSADLPASTGHEIPIEQLLNEADQQENSRREFARLEASRASGEHRLRLQEKERKKQEAYDEYRAMLQEAMDRTSA